MLSPSDYDERGWLRLPRCFWLILLLQARTWVVLVLAAASRQEGESLLAFFYPDREAFWGGMLVGIPAVIAFLLGVRRDQLPLLWHRWHPVLIVTQSALLLWQFVIVVKGEAADPAALFLATVDIFALWWLASSRYLRACFVIPQA